MPTLNQTINANLPTNTSVQSIDAVDASLNALPPGHSPAQLSSVLSRFFSSWPGLYSVAEADDVTDALYIYCRSQIILERYINEFPPFLSQNLNFAIQKLIYMQDQIGTIFGPLFQRAASCRTHSSSKNEYASSLPAQNSPSYPHTPLSQQTLSDLRQNLTAAGLFR